MLLEVKNLKKYFSVPKGMFSSPRYVRAIDNIDLAINERENLGLVGESGSGKTTVARAILKLYKVDQGSIILNGCDLVPLSGKKMRLMRKNIQMVFQDPYHSLDPRYTIAGILKEADQIVHGKEGREKRMIEILEAVGLAADCLNRYPHEFSGGERQRIAIARALIMNPKLLILDEAVSSLDVLIQEQIIALLKDLQQKFDVTYLFISHNLRVVKKICKRIAVMYKGKIVELAESEELFSNPLHPYTQELLSSAINYQSQKKDLGLNFDENSCLIDRGNGHFVID